MAVITTKERLGVEITHRQFYNEYCLVASNGTPFTYLYFGQVTLTFFYM
jgi:hypothetical protein